MTEDGTGEVPELRNPSAMAEVPLARLKKKEKEKEKHSQACGHWLHLNNLC